MSLGDHRQEIQNKLCNMLHDDPVVSVLMKVPEEHWSELCQLYLYDILRSAHSVPHHKASDEYEVHHYNYFQWSFYFSRY